MAGTMMIFLGVNIFVEWVLSEAMIVGNRAPTV